MSRMLFCLQAFVWGCFLVSSVGAEDGEEAAKSMAQLVSEDDVSIHMFGYFFDSECLTHVTPLPGRVPLEDTFAFFHEHLGELRVDTTIWAMLAFAGLVTLTLTAEPPSPSAKIETRFQKADGSKRAIPIGKLFFLFWATNALIQCVLLLFAIIFAVCAYISLHENYGSCLVDWKTDSFPRLHLVVGLMTGFQPAFAQRFCALQCSFVAMLGASKQHTSCFHTFLKGLQKSFGLLNVVLIGYSVTCSLATGAFAFSAMFLPSFFAILIGSALGLLLLFGEALGTFWLSSKWAGCCRKKSTESQEGQKNEQGEALEEGENQFAREDRTKKRGRYGDESERDEHWLLKPRHHASWVADGLQEMPKPQMCSACREFKSAPREKLSEWLQGGYAELLDLSTKPHELAFYCLLWMAACPMMNLGTWVAWCAYSGEFSSDELSQAISRAYSFLFRAALELELQWPSFADLTALEEIPKVLDYIADLKDFTEYSPTYLITGSKVVSLLSFVFAALKAFSGQLIYVLEKYGSISDAKVNVSEGLRLDEVSAAAGKDEDEFIQSLKTYKKQGFSTSGLLGIQPNVIDWADNYPELFKAGYKVKDVPLQELLDVAHVDLRRNPGNCDELAGMTMFDRRLFEMHRDKLEHWKRLYILGYTAKELKNHGIDLKEFAEWTKTERQEIHKGCEEVNVEVRVVSAKELKACGFELKALKDVGIKAADLKTVYTATELRNAGFTATELSGALIRGPELKKAGFNSKEIAEAQHAADNDHRESITIGHRDSMSQLFDASTMKKEGCTLAEMKRSYPDVKILYESGWDLKSLKEEKTLPRFHMDDIARTGADPKALKQFGCSAKDLHQAGVDAKVLKAIGYDIEELFKAVELEGLKELGFSAKECIKVPSVRGLDGFQRQHCCIPQLVRAGFDAKNIKDAGFDTAEDRQKIKDALEEEREKREKSSRK